MWHPICVTHQPKHLSKIDNPSEWDEHWNEPNPPSQSSKHINSSKYALFLSHLHLLNVVFDCSWSSPSHSHSHSHSSYMTDHMRLVMYTFALSHFNNFVIYEAFCQITTYVLNIDFPFPFLHFAGWSIWGTINNVSRWEDKITWPFFPSICLAVTTVSPWTSPILPKCWLTRRLLC